MSHPHHCITAQELLLSGLPQIDLADWRANTEYGSEYSAEHPTIKVCGYAYCMYSHCEDILQCVCVYIRVCVLCIHTGVRVCV